MNRTNCTFVIALAVGTGGLVAMATPAQADPLSDQVCAPSFEVAPLRRLRQTSLDLLGRPPTFEEIEMVTNAEDEAAAVDELITGMFDGDEFRVQMAEHHRSLLWGGLDQGAFSNVQIMGLMAGTDVWQRVQQTVKLRTRGDRFLDCLDQPQVNFTDGLPDPIVVTQDEACFEGECRQEGWVMVTPYWSDTPIKVCAFDAIDKAFAPDGETPCNSRPAGYSAGCGCGPNLEQCWIRDIEPEFREHLMSEGSELFAYFATAGRNYMDAFSTNLTMMNGPIVHYYGRMGIEDLALNGITAEGIHYDGNLGELPALDYLDADTWELVERGEGHAGAFTTAGYLMRFASNRGRANRFYTAFYCDPFVPSADGLPPEELNPSPNLRERAGCKDCHETLEVAAAHFTRWRTAGDYGYFSKEILTLDTPREDCLCGEGQPNTYCSPFCGQYHVTADNADLDTYELYGGLPMSLVYAGQPDQAAAADGPAAFVDQEGERRAVAECAVRNMAEALLHRPIEFDELEWVESIADEFEANQYDFTSMVEAIVMDDRYIETR